MDGTFSDDTLDLIYPGDLFLLNYKLVATLMVASFFTEKISPTTQSQER